jgi:ABC-2 type transport system ATP-binding protein/lipopolysaccharide transport system ATP-binding protein
MSAIVVEGVSKKFRLQTDRAHSIKELVTRRDRSAGVDQFWALRDVSLEIPEGSMYALIGHNGCGKSTLLRCIAGIYRPTEGNIEVSGRISTLLELGAGFHPDLTGRENVYMNATILGMGRKQIDRVFDSIVDFAGIEEFIDSPVKIYSSGMYIRLGFSVAVHVDPEILIVDEVIAVGDEEFQRKCFDHLYGLRRQGVTIVVVTHGMGTVETMCDGATWLDHGVVQMSGDAGEVASAYVAMVNRREHEQRAAAAAAPAREDESDASEIEAADEGQKVVEVEEAAGEAAEDGYVPEPWLGEDVQILDAYFTNSAGEQVTVIPTGDELHLNIRYRAHTEVDNPVFGFILHSENDIQIMGTNTKVGRLGTGELHGDGTVGFVFPSLELLPGNYDVTIGVNDKYVQHVFDRHPRRYHLTVRRGTRPHAIGFVEMPGRWSIEPGADVRGE